MMATQLLAEWATRGPDFSAIHPGHGWVTVLIILGVIYLLIHSHHTRRRWRRHSHLPFGARVWVSIPGPFGTRISKRF